MAQKPSNTPDWIPDDSTGIIVPGGSKQTSGWFKDERPPYQFFNWFFNIVSQFIHYFSSQAEYNITIDTIANEGDYATLRAYIDDSPAAGDRVLVKVDEEITGPTMVIPANILLKQQKGKKLWCDEDINVLTFSDGVVTEGDLLLELSHTDTVPTAVSFNGDDNNHCNIILKNTSTGTITNAFKIELAKKGNLARGEVINPSGTVTNVLVDSSGVLSNHLIIRESGGIVHDSLAPRTATANKSDSPAPDASGGGTVWAEFRTNGTTAVLIDNSVDYRDRFVSIQGYAEEVATSRLPGQANDDQLMAYKDCTATSAGLVLQALAGGVFYTESGGDVTNDPVLRLYAEGQTQSYGIIVAHPTNGGLYYDHGSGTPPTNERDIILKIDYSPVQNHY